MPRDAYYNSRHWKQLREAALLRGTKLICVSRPTLLNRNRARGFQRWRPLITSEKARADLIFDWNPHAKRSIGPWSNFESLNKIKNPKAPAATRAVDGTF
jgi:hypothetical protein